MIIYPAIDLSKGYIVRLLKGNFDKKKIYTKNILNQAKLFEDKGTTWIHVVDLDGNLLFCVKEDTFESDNSEIDTTSDVEYCSNGEPGKCFCYTWRFK